MVLVYPGRNRVIDLRLWLVGSHISLGLSLCVCAHTHDGSSQTNVVAVFIASEEAMSEKGVGIDGLMEAGRLDALRNGTVLWLDSADSQPYVVLCVG